MRPRPSFSKKPDAATPFRLSGSFASLWLAALVLALVLGAGPRLQAAPIDSQPEAGVGEPEEEPAEDAGAAGEVDDRAGQEESGDSPIKPGELDGGQVPKPDIKQGGESEGNPQSTEENKQDRLRPPRGAGQRKGLAVQQGNLPLIAPLDRGKMLGELYDQLPAAKDLGEARSIMQSIEELWRSSGSDTIDLLLGRSERFIKDTDLDLAAEILDAAIDLAPETAEAWHKRATVEFLRKDYESALADLRRSLSLDPRNYRAMNDLGIMLEAAGQKKDALEAYRKALKANPFLDEARDAIKELTHEVEGQDI
jgi:tetratricopeptide (TPR) repeat protein